MKTMVTIILGLIISISALAQNSEPTTHQFLIDNHYITPRPDSGLFQQNRMLLGWHWG